MSFKSLSVTAVAVLALFAASAQAQGLANGSFEAASTGTPAPPGGSGFFAANWLFAPTGNPVQWSTEARTGTRSALLTVPTGFGGSTLFQNSVDHGLLAPLGASNVGFAPVLSFWAKGDVSTTGNVLFSLRYLAANGAILANSGNVFFQSQINPTTWSNITYQGAAIPVGTAAMFLEMNTAVGPLLDNRLNAVYIDDITLAPIPEPGTYALLLAGLAVVGVMAKRRRAA